MKTSLTIALAAGGTGGHVFPAEALAEALQEDGHRVVLITDKRFNYPSGGLAKLERHTIRSGTLGRGKLQKLLAAFDILIGIFQARRILKKLKPAVVVGFGGYPSFPTMYAATGLGLPSVIHEQNSVLGRANRLLIRRVTYIATSFKNTRFIEKDCLPKMVFTGNPVRGAIRALAAIPYSELSEDGNIRILVTGGSQGATIFSQIIPAAIAALPGSLRSRIRIDQQCREQDVESTRAAYAQMQVSADISAFFVDMPVRLATAHLVIARAGASTIAELTAAGRPSILVPLPTSMDNHQYYNASAVEEIGASWMMPQEGFTASAVSARIEAFLNLPESLTRAANRARTMATLSAARDLADLVLRCAHPSRNQS